jgi:tetratricopeptide (TPR) repeat protein
MHRYRNLFLFLVCCAAVLPAGAAEWLKLQSTHFTLYTTHPEPVARQAIERLESVHAAFATLGSAPERMSSPLDVVLFHGYDEFNFYSPGHFVKAYFASVRSPVGDQEMIVVSDFAKDVDPILFHEFAHYCSKQMGGRLPMWLEEGLASYYESMEIENGRLTMGKPIPRHVKLLRSKSFHPIPFGDLFAMRNEERRDHTWDESAALYAQGWAIVHTLATEPAYASKFGQFVTRMRSGQPVQDALAQIYTTTIAQLRGEVEQHLRHIDAKGTPLTLAAGAPAEIRREPAPPWECPLMLTRLLAQTGKPVEAERDFEAMRKEFPKAPEIAEALGDFKYLRGEKVVALRHYRTAVGLGSQNPLVLLRVAEEDGARSETAHRAFVLLEESLRRHPHNHQLRMQAMEWAFGRERFDKAAEWAGTFEDSGDVPDFDVNFTSGYAHFRAGNPRQAKQWLDRAIARTDDAAEKDRAQAVLDRVEIALERRRYAERVANDSGLESRLVEPGLRAPVPPAASPDNRNLPRNAVDLAGEVDRSRDTAIDAERLDQTLAVFVRDRGGKVLAGTLHELRCQGAGAQLVILAQGKPVVLDLDEPGNILITRRGEHVANYDFRCGRQKPEAVHVGYLPAERAGRAGFLRILQFEAQTPAP